MQRFRNLLHAYPRQFWYLLTGMMINTTGMGMVWPFMTIYLHENMGLPLTTVTALFTLDSTMGIVASFIAGPVSDRFGRKGEMVLSLGMMGAVYITMSQVTSLGWFTLLMALRGLFQPLYRIGADAMVADMIPEEQRSTAYSLLRMMNNLGVAVGPSIGGFVASASYMMAFLIAASALIIFAVIVLVLMRETLPEENRSQAKIKFGELGYGQVLRDKVFMSFVAAFSMSSMGSFLVFILLGVYAKENFHIPETHIGFIMAVNAVMVVAFQYVITMTTRRHPPLAMLALGAGFYTVGIGSIALGTNALHFGISMAVLTIGELIMMPTSTSLAANLAPADMRGRYMSMYWLGWSFGHGIGPVVGGFLNDAFAPQAIWLGGAGWNLLSLLVFMALYVRSRRTTPAQASSRFSGK